ncbi:MAG: glycosyltransferase [Bacteroidetes bacterium]|nr:glycosyltransferase [Bacteroidota bacterium]
MKNQIVARDFYKNTKHKHELPDINKSIFNGITHKIKKQTTYRDNENERAEILFITSYPPRECGIATYSQDLIKALNNKFSSSLSIKVCALESGNAEYTYPREVKYILNTSVVAEYKKLAFSINKDDGIRIVLIQHEFGFFNRQEDAFLQFLKDLSKPVVIVFHTVLPHPDEKLKLKVRCIAHECESIIVMTHTSEALLMNEYDLSKQKISVIAHGTHLVPHLSENFLKIKYGLKGRKVLTTFGLLSSGKSIETTIEALPAIVKESPEVVFLVIGKTHPEVKKEEGEKYRESLEKLVVQYSLQDHVIFINNYLSLPELLEYLQLTDIYLFTTNDPNQAVSGTFAYAMSCACPIISTPIPHAKEILTEDTGIIFDFRNSQQLAEGVIRLLKDDVLRRSISLNTLQKIVSTAWENSAVAHAMLFAKISNDKIKIQYNFPPINLSHLKQMTTFTGIIQFSKVNQPDISTGYTLDDNARAMVAMCMYFKLTGDEKSLYEIDKYLTFIKSCQQPCGDFLNYVDENHKFTSQNKETNLDDSNGRAIWALGYVLSLDDLLPKEIISEAKAIIEKTLLRIDRIYSTRAMAFTIKGLYFYLSINKSPEKLALLRIFANRLVQMYKHESSGKWDWFESYLTYANSILPEAMLLAWKLTGETIYREIALSSFRFLLSKTFNENGIEVISNRSWLQKGKDAVQFGEQPIDVAYSIMTLSEFYDEFKDDTYLQKMEIAFNWFLGNNRLHQIIYNPCTGGCYDGLEETHANLNQGAESTVSYLMARLTMEKYNKPDSLPKTQLQNKSGKMHLFNRF